MDKKTPETKNDGPVFRQELHGVFVDAPHPIPNPSTLRSVAAGHFVCVGVTIEAESELVRGVVLTTGEGVKGLKQGKTYRVEFTELDELEDA